jgi:argininosuccinate lyase
MSSILKGGRLSANRADVIAFTSSLEADKRIARSTILVNEAHVMALARGKVIDKSDAKKLLRALQSLEHGIRFGKKVEDIHVLIEESVTHIVGDKIGGKLHTAKSRNDQVVTAIRMTMRSVVLELSNMMLSVETRLLLLAQKHIMSVFPGYTHLQPAQPITFSHYLLSVVDSFLRNNERLTQFYARVNKSPMGSGALAGSSFNIDRRYVARLLGFEGLIENSLDAVAGRDFVLEFIGLLSIVALDLSRLAQDLIFYSCADVGLIELPDVFASTSSIMPQKKNPDFLEVIRARMAKVTGNTMAAATLIHALSTGYNLDFQELTPFVWSSADTLASSLKILEELIPKLRLIPDSTEKASFLLTSATEIANILVRDFGFSFRDAHRSVGKAIREAVEKKQALSELGTEDWGSALGITLDDRGLSKIRKATDPVNVVKNYRTLGSPAPEETRRMIGQRTRKLTVLKRENESLRQELQSLEPKLREAARAL